MQNPAIRFKKEDGTNYPDWEKKILRACCSLITKGTTPHFYSTNKTDINFVKIESIKSGKVVKSKCEKIDNETHNNFLKRSILHENDILFAIAGSLGLSCVIEKNILPANTNQALAIIRLNDGQNLTFIYQALNSFVMQNYIKQCCTVGAQPNMSLKQIGNFVLPYPCLEEQQKIADFLSSVDEIISATEKELEDYKLQKKDVMQKIFSQKVRFKDDDGADYPDWEEKTIGDISTRITRKNKNNISNLPLTISSIYGLVDQTEYFNKVVASKDMQNYYLLYKGEFAYNKSYSKGFDYGSIKRLDKYAYGALSTLYICFALNDDVDSDFMCYCFDSQMWNKDAKKYCAEGGRAHGLLNISTDNFFKFNVRFPNSIEEQKKIADFLSAFDELIDETRQELECWKNIKKGLLQQMFI